MATHTEMSRVAADPAAVHTIARTLLGAPGADWTDWELDFLDAMSRYDLAEPLSQRQREVLFELRDKATLYRDYQGLSVRHLVRECYLARVEFNEEDEAFIARLHAAQATIARRPALQRLARLARSAGVIETV
jgi:hypothetical protein